MDNAANIEETEMIFLQSNEGEKFQVKKSLALKSDTIQSLLSHVEFDGEPVIPLPNVKTDVLKNVVTWLNNHENDAELTEEQQKNYEIVDEFDRQFFSQMNQSQHFEMINAANYLCIKRLLDNGCKLIAAKLIGKSVTQIREEFNIVNDYTPEEEEQIRRENAWLED